MKAAQARVVISVWVAAGLCAGPAHAGLYDTLTETSPRTPAEVVQLQENPYANAALQPVDKFTRGLLNTVTGVLELPRTVGTEAHNRGWHSALTRGVAEGFSRVGLRIGWGIWDLVTFPAPPYRKLRLRPEFVFGDATLYRGVPEQITWDVIEPAGSPLPDGPVLGGVATLPQPLTLEKAVSEEPQRP